MQTRLTVDERTPLPPADVQILYRLIAQVSGIVRYCGIEKEQGTFSKRLRMLPMGIRVAICILDVV